MSRAIPWNIRGVEPDAREAAADAALREGMTLGQWLKHTIETHAAERGLDAFCLDDDERAAAIKERLARIAGHRPARLSSVEPAQTRASPSFTPQSPNRVDEMLRNLAMRLEERGKHASQPEVDMAMQEERAPRPLVAPGADSYRSTPRETGASVQIDRKTELQEALRAARSLYAARPTRTPLRQEAHDQTSPQDAAQEAYP